MSFIINSLDVSHIKPKKNKDHFFIGEYYTGYTKAVLEYYEARNVIDVSRKKTPDIDGNLLLDNVGDCYQEYFLVPNTKDTYSIIYMVSNIN